MIAGGVRSEMIAAALPAISQFLRGCDMFGLLSRKFLH